uniref:DUF4265 domain-containing protein n=1 Tax=uncultured Polaribacter sp. TaxID=174711 RepID=UPI002633D80D|nr:DUF4265 domain-containing protein [uncultured Polaribacter sp.]
MENNLEKILFKYQSNVLDEIVVETMWAEIIDKEKGIYKLDSIPFYGPLIATDDEFYAEYDESEERITYRETTKHSGNSIVLISIVKDNYNKEILRDEFKSLNCTSEGVNDSYFSMEILSETNYKGIKARLDKYEEDGLIEYAEPCLSSKHLKDINN